MTFSVKLIKQLIQSGNKFPESIQTITFLGDSSKGPGFSFNGRLKNHREKIDLQALLSLIPVGLERLAIHNSTKEGPINGEGLIDFSVFPHLVEILWNLSIPLPALPPSLKTLKLGKFFDLETSELPEDIEELSFSEDRDSGEFHSLPNKLPRNLKILQLGNKFNEPIYPGQLPAGLKILKLSKLFNYPLELGVFPRGIEIIEFSARYFDSFFTHPLTPGLFPDSLKELSLHFNDQYNHPILSGVLPKSLESLELQLFPIFSHPLPPWPPLLKCLVYDEWGNPPNRIFPSLPLQLQSIEFGGTFQRDLLPGVFPPSIENIDFGTDYTRELVRGIFPAGVKKVRLGDYYDDPLPVGIFPEGIISIELGHRFSHPLEVGLFPSSVKHLIISTKHPLPLGLFPEGLETIEFGRDFDEELLPGIFPSSIRSLKFYQYSNSQDFLPGCLPEFLCELQLSPKYCGLFPSSALPPYFLPDSSIGGSAVPHRLKIPEYFDRLSPAGIDRMISRIGRDRRFLVKKLRVPISDNSSHVFIHPLDGSVDGFIVSERYLGKIPVKE